MSTNPDDVTLPGWTIGNVQFETPHGAWTPPSNIPFFTDEMLAAVAKAAFSFDQVPIGYERMPDGSEWRCRVRLQPCSRLPTSRASLSPAR